MPTTAELLNQARAHHQAGRITEAKALYAQVLEGQAEEPHALHMLGTIEFYEGNDAAAVTLIERSIKADPDVCTAHISLANILCRQERFAEARSSAERAVELGPDSAPAHCMLGDTLSGAGKRDDAIASYLRALALAPGGDEQLTNSIRSRLHQLHSYPVTPLERRHIHWLSYVTRQIGEFECRRVLDIGSEIFWLIGLASKFEELITVDIRSHPYSGVFPFRHLRADILDLPFDDAAFDLITMPQVLHWAGSGCYGQEFSEDVTTVALREVNRVLRPRGGVIGATFVKPGATMGKAGTQKTFGARHLLELFEGANLELVESEYFLHETMETASLEEIEADRARDVYPYPRYVSPYFMLFTLTRSS